MVREYGRWRERCGALPLQRHPDRVVRAASCGHGDRWIVRRCSTFNFRVPGVVTVLSNMGCNEINCGEIVTIKSEHSLGYRSVKVACVRHRVVHVLYNW